MILTGVLVAVAILVTLLTQVNSKARIRIATALSLGALLAAAGCSSDSSTNASDVSSNLSSAAETLTSSAESAGSQMSSAAESAGTDMQSAADTAMTSGAESSMAAGGVTSAMGSGTYAPEQAQLCQARDELRTSLGQLTDPGLLTQGATAIGAAVDTMQKNLDAVVTAAQPELKPQLDALQSSLEKLRTAVGDLGNGSVAANMQAVGSAAGEVGSSSTAVLSELDKICGS